jgi:P-type Ca2+ transporter type 2C
MKTAPSDPHTLNVDELLKQLATDPETGLSESDVRKRQEQFGPNQFQEGEPISPWAILVRQFQDLMVLILLIATGVAFGSWWLEGAEGIPSDGIVILAIVIANAILGFSQEYQAERTIEELQKSTAAKARVVRDGQEKTLEQSELTLGDIVLLGEGDRVPADLILIRSSHLQANESMLTGESVPVAKKVGPVEKDAPLGDRLCEVYAGTTITAGEGRAAVVQIGSNTEIGNIATSLGGTTSESTPMERRLNKLGKQIGWGVLALSVIIGATVLIVEGNTDLSTLSRVAMFSVALAVAAVPEGLPAVLTVSLSAGARRLAGQNAVARRMAAVETLGSVTTIVTDKTGTLTHNQMTVRKLFTGDEVIEVTGDGYSSEGKLTDTSGPVMDLVRCGVMANKGSLEKDEEGHTQAVGDPMDAALLVLAEKAGIDWREVRKEEEIVSEAPFSSDRARVSILRKSKNDATLYVKGAQEVVIERSVGVTNGQRFQQAEIEFADDALRTLAFGKKEGADEGKEAVDQEEGFTLIGLAAFEDPPREEVKPALEKCRKAGIRVIMCTGDHPATATAIARKVGLADENEQAVTGSELAKMSDEEFDQQMTERHVLARVSPDQKLKVVESLIRQGEVAAMTGDGVNDAPALKKVHVGVSMGKSGTAVAVEASDLVLMDDNFTTIVKAIEEGRSVFNNVQRFIAFLFSGNFGVVTAMFLGTIMAGIFDLRFEGDILLPLTAAQILWMNLVTDGAPAVAFALGRGAGEVMDQPPRDPQAPILDRGSWLLVGWTGTVLAAIFLFVLDVLYAGGLWTFATDSHEYAQSAAFYTLVTARLLNAFNFLDLHGSVFSAKTWKNKYVPGACLFSWLLTLGVIFFPPAANMFGLVPLSMHHLTILTLSAPLLVLIPAETYKLLEAKYSKK